MKRLKKMIVLGVMMMTVFSMSVVVAPQASAASAGDLIKMDGLSSVYYLGADGKRYVFPNESTYFSWYSDFSSVVTIPQSELESYPLGANVTVRPGTYLVKITTNPKVYAVTPGGELLWIPSEAVAMSLYGADWAQRVIDVPDAFFTNYTETAGQASATEYPAGSLVSFGGADIYYINADGMARPIADEAAFAANRFDFDFVINSDLDMPATGASITTKEDTLSDTSEGAGGQAGAGTGVSVALASDTPAGRIVPQNAPVELLKFNVTASNDGAVIVNSVKISAFGISPSANIDEVTAYDGIVKLSNAKDMNSDNEATLNFSGGYTVPAGMTKTFTVRAKINDIAGTYAIGIEAAADIATNGAVVSGSFPMVGNAVTPTSANLGSIEMDGMSADTATAEVGEDDVLLATLTLNAGANEDVLFESARFENKQDDGVVSNVRLLIDGEEVATADFIGDYITFDTENYLIEKNDNIDVEVRGDINVVDVSDTFHLAVDDLADFRFVGQEYGYEIEMTLGTGSLDTGILLSLEAGEVTLNVDKTAQVEKTRSDVNNVRLAVIEITSNGEDAVIEEITTTGGGFYIATSSGVEIADLENIELRDLNGGVYALDLAYTGNIMLTLDEEIYLTKGVKKTFVVEADVKETMPNDESLRVTLNAAALTIKGQTTDSTIVNITPSSVQGNSVDIEDASFELTTLSQTDKTVVEGASDVLIYKGRLEVGEASLVDLRSIQLTAATSTGVKNLFDDDYVSQLKLVVGGKTLETKTNAIQGDGAAGAYIKFSSLNATDRKVAAGANVDVEVWANFSTTFNMTGGFQLYVDAVADVDARDVDSTTLPAGQKTINIGSANYSRAMTLVDQGDVKVELKTDDTKANDETYTLAGTTTEADKYLGELVITTENEDVIIEELVLTETGSSTINDIEYVNLYDEAGVMIAQDTPSANGSVTFDNLDITVPADEETSWFIGVTVKSINDKIANGTATFDTDVIFNIGSVKAKGKDSAEDISPSVSGDATIDFGEFSQASTKTKETTITASKLTSVVNAMDDGNLVGGTRTIGKYKFVFDNANNQSAGKAIEAALKELTLSFATSTGLSVSNVKAYIEGDQTNVTSGTSVAAGSATINLTQLSDNLVDGEVVLVITATIGGTIDTGAFLATQIDDLSAGDFVYNGNGGVGVDFSDARIGITEVLGATLDR